MFKFVHHFGLNRIIYCVVNFRLYNGIYLFAYMHANLHSQTMAFSWCSFCGIDLGLTFGVNEDLKLE